MIVFRFQVSFTFNIQHSPCPRAISVLLGEAWKNLQTEEREAFSQKAKVC